MTETVDIAEAFDSLIRGSTDITDIIGTRLYNDHLPQTNRGDAIAYRIISELPHMSLLGATGIDQPVFQVDAYSNNRSTANRLASLVWYVTDAIQGVVAGIEIRGVTRIGGLRYLTDRAQKATDQSRFITQQDLMFTYLSIPTPQA